MREQEAEHAGQMHEYPGLIHQDQCPPLRRRRDSTKFGLDEAGSRCNEKGAGLAGPFSTTALFIAGLRLAVSYRSFAKYTSSSTAPCIPRVSAHTTSGPMFPSADTHM